jgi:hypothetical protein
MAEGRGLEPLRTMRTTGFEAACQPFGGALPCGGRRIRTSHRSAHLVHATAALPSDPDAAMVVLEALRDKTTVRFWSTGIV